MDNIGNKIGECLAITFVIFLVAMLVLTFIGSIGTLVYIGFRDAPIITSIIVSVFITIFIIVWRCN